MRCQPIGRRGLADAGALPDLEHARSFAFRASPIESRPVDAISPAEFIDSQHDALLFLNAKNPAAGNQAFGGFVTAHYCTRFLKSRLMSLAGALLLNAR